MKETYHHKAAMSLSWTKNKLAHSKTTRSWAFKCFPIRQKKEISDVKKYTKKCRENCWILLRPAKRQITVWMDLSRLMRRKLKIKSSQRWYSKVKFLSNLSLFHKWSSSNDLSILTLHKIFIIIWIYGL